MFNTKKTKCPWATFYSNAASEAYAAYHDEEWGVPVMPGIGKFKTVSDCDRHLYEMIVLELNQAGLSWATILAKRGNFRKAYQLMSNQSIKKIAKYSEKDVDHLLKDEGIIRNRAKINAAITNAISVERIQAKYGSLCAFLWALMPETKPVENKFTEMRQIPASTPLSDAIAKHLVKVEKMTFLGTKTVYAYMQSCGFVNDHLKNCTEHSVCYNMVPRDLKTFKGKGASELKAFAENVDIVRKKLRTQHGYTAPNMKSTGPGSANAVNTKSSMKSDKVAVKSKPTSAKNVKPVIKQMEMKKK